MDAEAFNGTSPSDTPSCNLQPGIQATEAISLRYTSSLVIKAPLCNHVDLSNPQATRVLNIYVASKDELGKDLQHLVRYGSSALESAEYGYEVDDQIMM